MDVSILQKILCCLRFPVQRSIVLVNFSNFMQTVNVEKVQGNLHDMLEDLFIRLKFAPLGSGSANPLNTHLIACWTFSRS